MDDPRGHARTRRCGCATARVVGHYVGRSTVGHKASKDLRRLALISFLNIQRRDRGEREKRVQREDTASQETFSYGSTGWLPISPQSEFGYGISTS